jgi:hypothetical protein
MIILWIIFWFVAGFLSMTLIRKIISKFRVKRRLQKEDVKPVGVEHFLNYSFLNSTTLQKEGPKFSECEGCLVKWSGKIIDVSEGSMCFWASVNIDIKLKVLMSLPLEFRKRMLDLMVGDKISFAGKIVKSKVDWTAQRLEYLLIEIDGIEFKKIEEEN